MILAKINIYLNFFHDLHYIFVMQNMIFSNFLRLMFDRRSPNQSIFHLFQNSFVNLVTKIFNAASLRLEDYRGLVIGELTFGLCVNPDQFQVAPHFFQKRVIIPFVMSRNWYTVGNFGDDIQFFNGNLKIL